MAVNIPFMDLVGCEVVSAAGGIAEVAVDVRHDLTNSWGVAHGGVVFTLADIAIARALRSAMPDGENAGIATVEMKLNFTAPGKGRLTARAELRHRGGTFAVAEVAVRSDDGTLVALGTGTFVVKGPRPAPQ